MRKCVALFLTIFCITGLIPSKAIAVADTEIVASGFCGAEGDGNNLTWMLDRDGVLSISGMGDMSDYGVATLSTPWGKYVSDIQTIGIEQGVTRVGNFAFRYCSSVDSVKIPDGLVEIGCSAFGCRKLESITIPDSVTTIQKYAFEGCDKLSKIVFEGSAPTERKDAFWGVIATAYYPKDDSTWTEDARKDFSGQIGWLPAPYEWEDITGYCGAEDDGTNLSWRLDQTGTLTISGTGKMFTRQLLFHPEWCKYRALIRNVIIEDGVTSIGACAFNSCYKITSIEIPDSVTDIEGHAFWGCSELTDLSIPESITTIPVGACSGCEALSSVTIPMSVTSIEEAAFSNCTNLETISLPDSVTKIGSSAFSDCSKLENIDIPESVAEMGSGTFSGCTSLLSVIIPNGITDITTMFEHCSSLKTVNLPGSVEFIGDGTFAYCESLESIVLPEKITSIDTAAFYGCSSLREIDIPETVVSIGYDAFTDCINLSKIRFYGNAPVFQEEIPAFQGVTAAVYYPVGDATWTDEIMQDYGGELTWIPYIPCKEHFDSPTDQDHLCDICGEIIGQHEYTSSITDPTCTEPGFTTFTCNCGDRYVGDEVAALGHRYTNYISNNDATCETDGTKTALCDRGCGAKDTLPDVGSRLAHRYDVFGICEFCGRSEEILPFHFAVSRVEGLSGNVVEVKIDVEGNPGIIAACMELSYDAEKLTLVEVVDTGLLKDAIFSKDLSANPYLMRWEDSMETQNNMGVGTIAVLKFKIAEDCALGKIPICLTLSDDEIYNSDLETIEASSVNGYVEVIEYVPGDANGDKAVNSIDVTLLRRYLAKWENIQIHERAMDVSHDGRVNSVDVTVLRRYLAHWPNVSITSETEEPARRQGLSSLQSDHLRFSVSDVSGVAGEEVTIAISMENNPGIIAACMELAYDSDKLQLVSVTDGGILNDYIFSQTIDSNPYALRWEDSLATENNTAEGVIATLTFRILEDCEPGTTAVELSFLPGEVYDTDLESVDFEIKQGTVTIEKEKTVSYDPETGMLTLHSLPEGTDVALIATYQDGQMIGIVAGMLGSDNKISSMADADKIKVFYLDSNHQPVADDLEINVS